MHRNQTDKQLFEWICLHESLDFGAVLGAALGLVTATVTVGFRPQRHDAGAPAMSAGQHAVAAFLSRGDTNGTPRLDRRTARVAYKALEKWSGSSPR